MRRFYTIVDFLPNAVNFTFHVLKTSTRTIIILSCAYFIIKYVDWNNLQIPAILSTRRKTEKSYFDRELDLENLPFKIKISDKGSKPSKLINEYLPGLFRRLRNIKEAFPGIILFLKSISFGDPDDPLYRPSTDQTSFELNSEDLTEINNDFS